MKRAWGRVGGRQVEYNLMRICDNWPHGSHG